VARGGVLVSAQRSGDKARVANDPRIQRAIRVVLVLLFVAVFGMIALAAALLRG
jgi:hypothetical protein